MASVLAPRLIVKEPAIGQRSMFTESVGDLTEVILKSGDFLNPALARRGQLWLVRGVLYKGLARWSDFPFPQQPGTRHGTTLGARRLAARRFGAGADQHERRPGTAACGAR